MKSNFEDVQDFHDRFGLSAQRPGSPSFLSDELQRFRLGFLIEELSEYAKEVGAVEMAITLGTLAIDARTARLLPEKDRSLVKAFDALLDLNVVSHGTADFHGFPWQRGWEIVHACNMAKRRARPDGSDSKRGSPDDVVKPVGWVGPEEALAALLEHRW